MVSREEDQPLIRATREAGNIYYGMTFGPLIDQPVDKEASTEARDGRDTAAINWPVVVDGNPANLLIGTEPQFTYTALSSAAQGLGFLNLPADPDGTLRRLPLLMRYQGTYIPSLALRVMAGDLGISAENIIVDPGKSIRLKGARQGNHLAGGDIVIPIDKHGRMILANTDLADGLRHYSYSDIFRASEDSARFDQLKTELAGKIAIISETVEKKYEIRAITEKILPTGVIHAMVLQNLLSGSYLRELSNSAQVAIEIVLLVGIFFLSLRFSSLTLSLAATTLAGVYIGLAALIFYYAGIILQFTRPILLLLSTLTFLLIGLGIEKAVLFARSERARKIAERDLEIGREIQAGFFPTMLPETAGWELATHFQAARHVAGDFYDIFTLGKDNKVAIVIADVCDKGVGAALFMALFRSFIRVLSGSANSNGHLDIAGSDGQPEKILQHAIGSINNYISITHEQAGMFATIFYGILDPQRAVLTYINGGVAAKSIKGNPSGRSPCGAIIPDRLSGTWEKQP